MSIEDARLSMPTRGPRRSRTRSKVARPLTAATRPDISAKTQMPMTPSTVAHARDNPNRDPTWALVTRSPMSTKPPIAVRMPSATANNFFTGSPPHRRLGSLQAIGHLRQFLRQVGVLLGVATYQRDSYVGEQVAGVGEGCGDAPVHGVVARLGLLATEVVGGAAGVRLAVQGDDLLVFAEHAPVADKPQHQRHGRDVARDILHRQMRLITPRGVVRRLRRAG